MTSTSFKFIFPLKKTLILLPMCSMALAQNPLPESVLKADAVAGCCLLPLLQWSGQRMLTLPVLPDLRLQKPSGKHTPQPLPNYRPGTYRPIPIPTTFPDAKLVPLKLPVKTDPGTGVKTTELLIQEDAGAPHQTLLFK